MFLYGGIMLVVALIFALMAYFYTYSDFSGNTQSPVPLDAKEDKEMEGVNSSSHL